MEIIKINKFQSHDSSRFSSVEQLEAMLEEIKSGEVRAEAILILVLEDGKLVYKQGGAYHQQYLTMCEHYKILTTLDMYGK